MTLLVGNRTTKVVSDFVTKHINSPEQRLLQGVVALGIQPVIDYKNKGTDDSTRAVSVARTIGRIVAGTLVGVAVRYASIGAVKSLSKFKLNGKEINLWKPVTEQISDTVVKSYEKIKGKSFFAPKVSDVVQGMPIDKFASQYDNNIKIVGTLLGTAAMVFTNFLVDVPLTKWITKKLEPKVKAKLDSEKQVNNAAK